MFKRTAFGFLFSLTATSLIACGAADSSDAGSGGEAISSKPSTDASTPAVAAGTYRTAKGVQLTLSAVTSTKLDFQLDTDPNAAEGDTSRGVLEGPLTYSGASGTFSTSDCKLTFDFRVAKQVTVTKVDPAGATCRAELGTAPFAAGAGDLLAGTYALGAAAPAPAAPAPAPAPAAGTYQASNGGQLTISDVNGGTLDFQLDTEPNAVEGDTSRGLLQGQITYSGVTGTLATTDCSLSFDFHVPKRVTVTKVDPANSTCRDELGTEPFAAGAGDQLAGTYALP